MLFMFIGDTIYAGIVCLSTTSYTNWTLEVLNLNRKLMIEAFFLFFLSSACCILHEIVICKGGSKAVCCNEFMDFSGNLLSD